MIEENSLFLDTTSGSTEILLRFIHFWMQRDDSSGVIASLMKLEESYKDMYLIKNFVDKFSKYSENKILGEFEELYKSTNKFIENYKWKVMSIIGSNRRCLTFSNSFFLQETLPVLQPEKVYVTKSKPGEEGIILNKKLLDYSLNSVMIDDVDLSHYCKKNLIDFVIVSCDGYIKSQGFINKIGTAKLLNLAETNNVESYVLTHPLKLLNTKPNKLTNSLMEWVDTSDLRLLRYIE